MEKESIGGRTALANAWPSASFHVAAGHRPALRGLGNVPLILFSATQWQNMNSRGRLPAEGAPNHQFGPCRAGQIFAAAIRRLHLRLFTFLPLRGQCLRTASSCAPLNRNVVFLTRNKRFFWHNAWTTLRCDLATTSKEYHGALISNHQKLFEQKDAADYIQNVEQKIISRRQGLPEK
ncbi:MAG: hypothetical protein JWQ04_629 [Pedosphaera sp.]|nr:hypothetical protein [Pedosphaera sp.]